MFVFKNDNFPEWKYIEKTKAKKIQLHSGMAAKIES
jgi:hypothetical protein